MVSSVPSIGGAWGRSGVKTISRPMCEAAKVVGRWAAAICHHRASERGNSDRLLTSIISSVERASVGPSYRQTREVGRSRDDVKDKPDRLSIQPAII